MSGPPTLPALVAAILFLLGALHVYWAWGGARGVGTVIPTTTDGGRPFRPGRLATLLVAGALLLAGVVTLAAGEVTALPVPRAWVRGATWALSAVFALRALGDFRYVGVSKRVKTTPFSVWDTRLFTPLCATLALGLTWIASRA
ncbi:DUF3995 domain-containing protein [Deinococcus pimensis]|uniref:DUF3995 domain-containing protein n=1 Tax=Deinococcus pimensis TaxID=309888 RepID=UPI0004B382AC|nr:DUF3995 domain-containing protein [Deinococcus pimensis]